VKSKEQYLEKLRSCEANMEEE